jgi:hypothetical protein
MAEQAGRKNASVLPAAVAALIRTSRSPANIGGTAFLQFPEIGPSLPVYPLLYAWIQPLVFVRHNLKSARPSSSASSADVISSISLGFSSAIATPAINCDH